MPAAVRIPSARKTAAPVVDATEWGRGRLLAILATGIVVTAVVISGLIYAVCLAFAGVGEGPDAMTVPGAAPGDIPGSETIPRGAAHRDAIAAAPMLSVPESAAFPSDRSGEQARVLEVEIPTGTGVNGPGFVMTGFPQTPQGAIGQLAQIDLAVLHSMSLQTAEEVYRAWVLPGGVSAQEWWLTVSVRAFLASAGMGEVKDPGSSVLLEPVAALVKGTDGPDWTVACVLMKVTAVYKSQAQAAFAHCERMQWVGGRWMVAPGAPPAPAPATWPDTELAQKAGWWTWSTQHGTEPHGLHDRHGEQ